MEGPCPHPSRDPQSRQPVPELAGGLAREGEDVDVIGVGGAVENTAGYPSRENRRLPRTGTCKQAQWCVVRGDRVALGGCQTPEQPVEAVGVSCRDLVGRPRCAIGHGSDRTGGVFRERG